MPFTNTMFLLLFVLWQYQVFDVVPWQYYVLDIYNDSSVLFFHLHNGNTLFLTCTMAIPCFFGYGTMVIPCFVHVILPRAV